MSDFIRKEGADLLVEVTATDSNGDGITSVIAVSASIERTSDGFFWDSGTNAFITGGEPALDTLVHDREGLYSFTLVGGAEAVKRAYKIHLVITGGIGLNSKANINALFSDVILVEALTATQIKTEVDTALSDIFLDQLFANAYDSASPPGNVAAFLNELTEDDGGLTRFTANALEESPVAVGFPTVAAIADAVWDELISGHVTVDTFGAKNQNLIPSETIGDYKATGFSTQVTQNLIATDITTLISRIPDTISLANINIQADIALSDIFLDQLFANSYNSASPPGNVASFLNELTEDDGGLTRFTANALEESPAAVGVPTVDQIADAVWDELKSGHVTVGTFGESVPSDLIKWDGSSTVDTLSLTEFAERQVAYVSGRFLKDTPGLNDIRFFKQDNLTPKYTMNIAANERTRL